MEQRGSQGGLVLSNPEVDEDYSTTLWETEVVTEVYESSDAYRELVAKLGDTLAEPPTRKVYEVRIQI